MNTNDNFQYPFKFSPDIDYDVFSPLSLNFNDMADNTELHNISDLADNTQSNEVSHDTKLHEMSEFF